MPALREYAPQDQDQLNNVTVLVAQPIYMYMYTTLFLVMYGFSFWQGCTYTVYSAIHLPEFDRHNNSNFNVIL